ncbi:hypothetical protein U0070_014208 [Myodes glareolus]|uniref:Uncharacterized protein n=1 Tax=Myodes glareolus TaxID=447135 RepID=A0AAW0INF0_MYOGA
MSGLLTGAHYGFRRVMQHPLWGPEMTGWKARCCPSSEGWLDKDLCQRPKVLGLDMVTPCVIPVLRETEAGRT